MTEEHEKFGEDPISDMEQIQRPQQKALPAAPPPSLHTSVMKTVDRQLPFFDLTAQFHKFFEDVPNLTPRQADERVQGMFQTFLDCCEKVGISKMSVPPLKECCGKKRVWKDEQPAQPGGWRVGDWLAAFFKKFGAKPCEGCKRRQAWLNAFFSRKKESS